MGGGGLLERVRAGTLFHSVADLFSSHVSNSWNELLSEVILITTNV